MKNIFEKTKSIVITAARLASIIVVPVTTMFLCGWGGAELANYIIEDNKHPYIYDKSVHLSYISTFCSGFGFASGIYYSVKTIQSLFNKYYSKENISDLNKNIIKDIDQKILITKAAIVEARKLNELEEQRRTKINELESLKIELESIQSCNNNLNSMKAIDLSSLKQLEAQSSHSDGIRQRSINNTSTLSHVMN